MKIIFFGTPFFAAEILDFLTKIKKKVDIRAVVIQPDEKKTKNISEVKKIALEKNIKIYQPENVSSLEFLKILKKEKADLFLTVAYGQIFKEDLLKIPTLDCINIHASLLPLYRGAAPIQRALMNGEKETGITIMEMAKGLDSGDIILQKEVLIDEKMNFTTLEKKLLEISKNLLIETFKLYEKGEVKKIKQDDSKATYAKKIAKEDMFIDFKEEALKIYKLIRALSFTPGARCRIEIEGKEKILKILECAIVEEKGKAGEILKFEKDEFIVACKDRGLKILKVQMEGKKMMEVSEFIRGMKKSFKIISFHQNS